MGTSPAEQAAADRDEEDWPRFLSLLTLFFDADHGLTARRAMERDAYDTDYDHLSRYGEWSATDDAVPERLT